MKRRWPYAGLMAACLILDQITKALIRSELRVLDSVVVIPGFLNLTRVQNRGAVFGFLDGGGASGLKFILITSAAVVALVFVAVYFFRTPLSDKLTLVGLTLIMSGAVGNLADRFLRGSVTDFIDMYVKKWHWPFYNAADSCITIGACFLIATLVFRRK